MKNLRLRSIERIISFDKIKERFEKKTYSDVYYFSVKLKTILSSCTLKRKRNLKVLILGIEKLIPIQSIKQSFPQLEQIDIFVMNPSTIKSAGMKINIQPLENFNISLLEENKYTHVISAGYIDYLTVTDNDELLKFYSEIAHQLENDMKFIDFGHLITETCQALTKTFLNEPIAVYLYQMFRYDKLPIFFGMLIERWNDPSNNVSNLFLTKNLFIKLNVLKINHLTNIAEIIRESRIATFINSICRYHRPARLEIVDIYSNGKLLYTINIYDYPFNPANAANLRHTVAIIPPTADQHHWIYKNAANYRKLGERADSKRILCIFLPEFDPDFKNIPHDQIVKQIKDEIGAYLILLSLDHQKPVVLLTQQEEYVDERIEVVRFDSPYIKEAMIFDSPIALDDEEFKCSDTFTETKTTIKYSKYFRRVMIFRSNPKCAQAEMWYYKDNNELVFNFKHICSGYVVNTLYTFTKYFKLESRDSKLNGLILGIGGGIVFSLIHAVYPTLFSLTGVDIDASVIDAAKKYFGLEEKKDQTELVIDDALNFVKISDEKYDFIMIDINGSEYTSISGIEGIAAPPKEFYSNDFLNAVKALISSTGVVIFNVITYDSNSRNEIAKTFSKHFACVSSLKFNHELNELFICGVSGSEENLVLTGSIRKNFTKLSSAFPALLEVIRENPVYLGKHSTYIINEKIWK